MCFFLIYMNTIFRKGVYLERKVYFFPCSRSWHWAAPSISPALFSCQSLLEWEMLSSIQKTRLQDLKANSVDHSSAVVRYPLPQTCSQATAHLSGTSCLCNHRTAQWHPAGRTPAAKRHVGQQQWSPLRGWLWSELWLAKHYLSWESKLVLYKLPCNLGGRDRQWPISEVSQGGGGVLQHQHQLPHRSIAS